MALTGDGGDELFGGYGWYQTARALNTLRYLPNLIIDMGRPLTRFKQSRFLMKVGKVAALMMLSPGGRYAALRQTMTPEVKDILYAHEFLIETGHQALDWLATHYDECNGHDPLNRMMAADIRAYLAEDLLVKVD